MLVMSHRLNLYTVKARGISIPPLDSATHTTVFEQKILLYFKQKYTILKKNPKIEYMYLQFENRTFYVCITCFPLIASILEKLR